MWISDGIGIFNIIYYRKIHVLLQVHFTFVRYDVGSYSISRLDDMRMHALIFAVIILSSFLCINTLTYREYGSVFNKAAFCDIILVIII